jgi:transcriptional antiterminator NusG
MAMRWYVVHAYSGYEKKVAAALKERIELTRHGGPLR